MSLPDEKRECSGCSALEANIKAVVGGARHGGVQSKWRGDFLWYGEGLLRANWKE